MSDGITDALRERELSTPMSQIDDRQLCALKLAAVGSGECLRCEYCISYNLINGWLRCLEHEASYLKPYENEKV